MHGKHRRATAFILAAAAATAAQLGPEFRDGQFHPIWNKTDLSNWQAHAANWRIAYPGADSAVIYTDGLSHPGGMTHLIYSKRVTGNIEIRAVMRMPTTGGANAGIQFRSRCQQPTGTLENNCGGSPWIVCGPQNDLGSGYSGDIYNGCHGAYVNSGTASTPPTKVNNTGACRAPSNFKGVDSWNTYLIRVLNDTAWTFLNGVNCSKLLLTGSGEKSATTQGLISLQYETQLKVEFKTLELRDLDAVPTALPAAPAPRSVAYGLQGNGRSLAFEIPEAGHYSVKITDMRGKVLERIEGMGPAPRRSFSPGKSGLLLVEIKSASGTRLQRMVAD